jgi:hypothetical protein
MDKEQHLGQIDTKIVGLQYYDARAKPGEKVYLEREPENSHDNNAVRAETLDFEKAGHLPRQLARWLAPLIDAGRVRVDAAVPVEAQLNDGQFSQPLTLDAFLCRKGDCILQPAAEPRDDREALHETVRHAFEAIGKGWSPEVARRLSERMRKSLDRDALPETHLLVALFESQARKALAARGQETLEEFRKLLAKLKIGKPQHHQNLTIFPISTNGKSASKFDLLEPAIKQGRAVITETAEGGSVPKVFLKNLGDTILLIPEGEILVGAKQNRVIQRTVLALAATEREVAVCCVEQGRWNHISDHFEAKAFAHPRLRGAKMQSIHASDADDESAGDVQGRVWDEVASCMSDLGAASATESLTDGFAASHDRLKDYRKAFALPENARGFIAASGDSIIGADVFDSTETMKKLWKRLSDAYFLEAVREPAARPKSKVEGARAFLKKVSDSIELEKAQSSAGFAVKIRGEKLAGSALLDEDGLVHLSTFSTA